MKLVFGLEEVDAIYEVQGPLSRPKTARDGARSKCLKATSWLYTGEDMEIFTQGCGPGSRLGAARILELPLSTLRSKIKKLGIQIKEL